MITTFVVYKLKTLLRQRDPARCELNTGRCGVVPTIWRISIFCARLITTIQLWCGIDTRLLNVGGNLKNRVAMDEDTAIETETYHQSASDHDQCNLDQRRDNR